MVEVWPGRAYPLGARWDGRGTNFAVFSEHAEAVELCLFDAGGERRLPMVERTAFVWHCYLPGAGPGQRYGFRVAGPWAPAAGHRCNPAKLLVDPYATAIDGELSWDPAVFGAHPDDPTTPDARDSAPHVPRSVVTSPFFDWGDDRPPRVPWDRTLLYETHVRGLTMRHPDVPSELRGTYAGLATPAVVDHLTGLGVTAVELQPVHHFVSEHALVRKGLRNYWGYNTLGFFAPHAGYAAAGSGGGQVGEFKAMVAALHEAGLEVVLDVVYNHTAEGDHRGPTLSFRGLDNRSYYRLDESRPDRYVDYTGTGNSMNARDPHVLQLVMDSLRYWVTEMHVDGFRFDLASTLARELHDVDRLSAFFHLVQQDPVVGQVKLIAEPWDVGEGGYQVGNFPPPWAEWNGKYRDAVRDLWRGASFGVGELASRLSGSSDLYAHNGRAPAASVNFVTAHDGFTLRDLVSYERKHNDANLDDSASGEDHNRSWNCGVEGPTDDPGVRAQRARQQRNLLATLLLSQGVPMLLGGDEFGRSQHGNNNPYCQDNELTWYDWRWDDDQRQLVGFVRFLADLRRRHPTLRRRRWFEGRRHEDAADLEWLRPDGTTMTESDWRSGDERALGAFLNGRSLSVSDARGRPVRDDSFLLLANADARGRVFTLPPARLGRRWAVVLDTARADEPEGARTLPAGAAMDLADRSLVLLRRLDDAGHGSAARPVAWHGTT
ncbi:glycogen debranching protein GlgX [soil metagenome]